MRINLVQIDIREIRDIPKIAHEIFAYAEGGVCEVEKDLLMCKTAEPADFKAILHSIKLVCANKRVPLEQFVKKDEEGRPVYELRAHRKSAQVLYFYYLPDPDEQREVIVCTNTYWKTDDKKLKQRRSFDRAEELRRRFMSAR